ncbi:hypothetical protein ACP4OV_029073 [Aristida adscensionis]
MAMGQGFWLHVTRGDHPPVELLHTSPPAMSAVEASRGLGAVLDYLREDPIGHTIHPASLRPPSHPLSSSGAAGGDDDDDDHATKWVLLDLTAYIADRRNASTAAAFTRAGHAVHATLCAARPPRVSHLCVHCPALPPADFGAEPRVLAAAGDLVLFQAAICNPSVAFEDAMQDFFVYHTPPPVEEEDAMPSLTLLPHPGDLLPCHLTAYNVGLLLRRHGRHGIAHQHQQHYIIAMLHRSTGEAEEERYNLVRFSSDDGGGKWSTTALHLGRMPPSPGLTSFCHITTKVIRMGGGFMGWVDLARGILLCDVLADRPVLHYIPLPQPLEAAMNQQIIGPSARTVRDIVVVRGHIKFAVHQTHERPWSFRNGTYILDDWTVATFRWKVDLSCWEGSWQEEFRCSASKMTGSLSELLGYKEATPLPALQNLHTGLPALSLNDDEVVYLLAKVDHRDKKGFVIAVNMKDGTLQGADYFGAERMAGMSFTYTQSGVSDYLKSTLGKKEMLKKRPLELLDHRSNKKPEVD